MIGFDNCNFEYEGARYSLAGNPFWPAVFLSDGRMISFCNHKFPWVLENLEVVSIDWLWRNLLYSERFVAKPRTSLPSNWFKWENARFESVFCPSPVGSINGKVLRVDWDDISRLATSEYTVEQAEDIKEYMVAIGANYQSLIGILRDSYRSTCVGVVANQAELIKLLPVATYIK